MLILKQWKAVAPRKTLQSLEKLSDAVSPTYHAILKPARSLQIAALQLDAPSLLTATSEGADTYRGRTSVLEGELYANGTEVVALRFETEGPRFRVSRGGELVTDEPNTIEARIFAVTNTAENDRLNWFVERAGQSLGMSFEPGSYSSDRFSELASEPGRTTTTSVDGVNLAGARLLTDRPVRALALAIKTSGGLLVSDLAKQLPGSTEDQIVGLRARLESTGLIRSETVVVCKKSQAQVARAPSEVEIAAMGAAGVRCGCGRAITDERIEAALTVTDLGRELLDSSKWFSLVLHEELVRVGVDQTRILLEQQQGGDEMDVLAELSGELIFFELKDKEFSLGNAYSFGAKIGIIRPDHSVIVTSDKVGNDAKDHFQRAGLTTPRGDRNRVTGEFEEKPPQIQYIEGLDTLSQRLSEIASSIYAADAAREFARVTTRASLDSSELVSVLMRAYTPGLQQSAMPQRRSARRSSAKGSG
jgi:hypothetical protein